MFISSVGWPRGFTDMHCNVLAHWIRIDMQCEAEKYKTFFLVPVLNSSH